MEIFWLLIAIAALIMALFMIGRKGWSEGAFYLIFPLLGAAMYGLRRFMRGRSSDN